MDLDMVVDGLDMVEGGADQVDGPTGDGDADGTGEVPAPDLGAHTTKLIFSLNKV